MGNSIQNILFAHLLYSHILIGFKMESDFIVLVQGYGIIYIEVKRTDRPENLKKAADQIEKIKAFVDIVTLECLGIQLPCAKVIN